MKYETNWQAFWGGFCRGIVEYWSPLIFVYRRVIRPMWQAIKP
jgi:hypothetical protein